MQFNYEQAAGSNTSPQREPGFVTRMVDIFVFYDSYRGVPFLQKIIISDTEQNESESQKFVIRIAPAHKPNSIKCLLYLPVSLKVLFMSCTLSI
jgi:hypothetical protein